MHYNLKRLFPVVHICKVAAVECWTHVYIISFTFLSEKPVSPAAAAWLTTPLEMTWRMTSEWDASSRTHPTHIWQPRSKAAAAFACTRGTAWLWPIRLCRAKTRLLTPQRTTGRQRVSTKPWWGASWGAGGGCLCWRDQLETRLSCRCQGQDNRKDTEVNAKLDFAVTFSSRLLSDSAVRIR